MDDTSTHHRPLADTTLRAAAVGTQIVAALILVQAFLAGRYLFGPWTITAHGIIGNAVFALAVAVAIGATIGRARRGVLVEAWLLTLLLTTQIGLGYSGRTSVDAAAWHIPVGVAAFGLAVRLATRLPATRGATSS